MTTNGSTWDSALAGVDQAKWEIKDYRVTMYGYVIDWKLKD
jgi:hypothetical protein